MASKHLLSKIFIIGCPTHKSKLCCFFSIGDINTAHQVDWCLIFDIPVKATSGILSKQFYVAQQNLWLSPIDVREIKDLLTEKGFMGKPNICQRHWLQSYLPLWKVKGQDSIKKDHHPHIVQIVLPLGSPWPVSLLGGGRVVTLVLLISQEDRYANALLLAKRYGGPALKKDEIPNWHVWEEKETLYAERQTEGLGQKHVVFFGL